MPFACDLYRLVRFVYLIKQRVEPLSRLRGRLQISGFRLHGPEAEGFGEALLRRGSGSEFMASLSPGASGTAASMP
jgi:hypothetical protein